MHQSRMDKLAQTFPSLEGSDGLDPWKPKELATWAQQFDRDSNERVSAQFVLWVSDPFSHWRCGPFHLLRALVTWDEAHRAAFAAWVKSPWWG